MPKTIAIIPVKSDSKRFPDKNFKEISLDNPLIINTLDKLFKCGQIDDVYISTDDVARVHSMVSYTDRLPDYAFAHIHIVERPANLVGGAKSEDVMYDVYDKHLDHTKQYTFILAQVTSPTWHPTYLKHAIVKHHELKVPIISVSPDFKPNGCFYIINLVDLHDNNSLYSNNMYLKVLPWEQSIDIDYEYQLHIAQAIYSERIYLQSIQVQL